MERSFKAKMRLLNYLDNKGLINLDNYYVVTIDSVIRLQGHLTDTSCKDLKVFKKEPVWDSERNWIKLKSKNFDITLTIQK